MVLWIQPGFARHISALFGGSGAFIIGQQFAALQVPWRMKNPLHSRKKAWQVIADMIKSGINTVYCYFIRNVTISVVATIHAWPDTTKQHMNLLHSQRRSESGKKVLICRIIYVYLWMLSLIICAFPVK
jgi:hypothetical protein